MIKKTAVIASISLVVMLSGPILAQDTTNSNSRNAVDIRSKRVDVIKDARVKIASREATLKQRLNRFQNRTKANLAERINTNLNKINQNQTDRMLKHLETMSDILSRLETRVNQATPDIKDTQAALEAIVTARDVIATASAEVSAQAEKDYTITVSSESTVRKDMQTMRDLLHTDLRSVRELVIAAKQSVAAAIRVAKSGKMELLREGTASGQQ